MNSRKKRGAALLELCDRRVELTDKAVGVASAEVEAAHDVLRGVVHVADSETLHVEALLEERRIH